MSYYHKYLKYKNKYINLRKQLGGECDPLPDMNDNESISYDQYSSRTPNDRITINGICYFVDEIFNWVITLNNNNSPHRTSINPSDRQRIITAYNILHPLAPHQHVAPNPENAAPNPDNIQHLENDNIIDNYNHYNYDNHYNYENIIPNYYNIDNHINEVINDNRIN